MTKIKWAVAALVITGLASPIATVQARTHKHHKSSATSEMNNKSGMNSGSGMTTGANSKPTSANPSSQGNVGPGTNQAGSKSQ